MKIFSTILFLLTTAAFCQTGETADQRLAAYQKRLSEVTAWRSSLVKKEDPKSGGLAEIAAKLARREDADWCSKRLIELMKEPSGDMFWMFPCVSVAYLGRDQLSAEAKQAMRETWRTYMPMRGDTENHWAMYYSSLYLMAQLWPDEAGDRWFTGKSSAENMAEALDYLRHWMDLTTTIGQGEYDCTHYIGEYCIPMLYLATWAEEPAMRKRGQMMLDWILADFAIDTLDGMYIGAHARTTDDQVLEKWNGLSSFFAWLYFGNCPPPASYGHWGVFFAAAGSVSDYRIPEVIYGMATDRKEPYLSFERKRTRHRWRNFDVRNALVYKTTYVTKDYALGSDQGGMLQPIQHHSWDVTWSVPDPRGIQNTLFSLNPYYSSEELQTFFTEFPDWITEAVTQQGKPTYNKEDKFLGGSPYEQVYQNLDTLIALYDIPAGTTFEHINGFFSKDLARLEEDPSGWIFAQGGNAFIAYRPLAAYEWREIKGGGKRLYSPHKKNGTVLQIASAGEFPNWEAFKKAILALPLKISVEPAPRVEFTTLRGRKIVCTYGKTPTVDGKKVDYSAWKAFDSPYLKSEVGSKKLVITHGSQERVLDFNTLTTIDRITEN
jgi:hypothetical protein